MAITKAMTSYKIILGDFNGLPKNQKNMKWYSQGRSSIQYKNYLKHRFGCFWPFSYLYTINIHSIVTH